MDFRRPFDCNQKSTSHRTPRRVYYGHWSSGRVFALPSVFSVIRIGRFILPAANDIDKNDIIIRIAVHPDKIVTISNVFCGRRTDFVDRRVSRIFVFTLLTNILCVCLRVRAFYYVYGHVPRSFCRGTNTF